MATGLRQRSETAAAPPAAAKARPNGQTAGMSSDSGDDEAISPERREFVENGMRIMFGRETMPTILKSIEGDGNPVEGLANTVVSIVTRLEDSAAQKGAQLDPQIVEMGGIELLEQAADLAEQAGVHSFTDEELTNALVLATDMYRLHKQQTGQIDQQQAQSEFSMLQQAEQAGQLEDILPGIGEFAKRSSQGQMPQDKARRGLAG